MSNHDRERGCRSAPFRRSHGLTGLLLLLLIAPIQEAGADPEGRYPSTRIYGYFDLEAEVNDKDAKGERWTFDQHHLTAITYVELSARYRVLFETSWEHGPVHEATDGTGKIYLPKAYLEYFRSDALRLRAGKFLPPFGIYNERHDATPTVIPTVLPPSVYGSHPNLTGAMADSLGRSERAYPRFASGVWLLGNLFAGGWGVEYNGYLVNGRGSDPDEKDDNTNKGLGTRIVLTPPGDAVRFGVSWYGDRNGELSDARQDAFGADIEASLGNGILEGGVILPRYEELTEDGAPDGHRREAAGAYLFAGYCFFDRLTPFVYHDVYDPDRDAKDDRETDTTVGANFALDFTVFLKGEVHFLGFEDDRDGYRKYITSVAVAF
ncbi:MAG: hypothetical protein ABIK65_06825 [Candidatus Eisenbacteria bacterium]